MQNNEITFKVAKLISEQLEKNEKDISLNCSFDELGADSLDQIEILMRTEEMFNIFITDQEAVKITCAQDLVNCVNKLFQK